MKAILYFIVFIFSSTLCWSQNQLKERTALLSMGYGIIVPSPKMPFQIGGLPVLEFNYVLKKGHTLGLDFNYMFGSRVNNDVLNSIRTAEGFIYGNNQSIAAVRLGWRGIYIGINWGTIKKKKGFVFQLGTGWMQHKYRIQEDPQSFVPQLVAPYKSGFEQLSAGLGFKQWIGYQHLDEHSNINYKIGLSAFQSFTQLKNAYQFVDSTYPKNNPHLFVALNISWILPFIATNPDTISY